MSWNISSHTTNTLVSGPIMAAGGRPNRRGLPMVELVLPGSGGEPGLSRSRRFKRSPSSGRDLGLSKAGSEPAGAPCGMDDDRRGEVEWETWGEAVGEGEMLMAEDGMLLLLWGLLLALLLVLRVDIADLSASHHTRNPRHTLHLSLSARGIIAKGHTQFIFSQRSCPKIAIQHSKVVNYGANPTIQY